MPLSISSRPRPVLRLVHRPACCRLVLRSVPRSVPRSSVVSSVSSSHSSFLAVLPPRAPFCSARRSAFRSSFRRRLVPRLVSSFRRRRSVLRLVPPSRSSSVGSSSLPVSSTREAGRFLFSFDSGRASKQGSRRRAGDGLGQSEESESRNEEDTSKHRTPRPTNRKNGEGSDKKPHKNTGMTTRGQEERATGQGTKHMGQGRRER